MLILNKTNQIILPKFLTDEITNLNVTKSFEQKFFHAYPIEFQKMLQLYIESLVDHKITISEGWMNCTMYTGVENSFDWHNEDGVGSNDGLNEGSYVCIIWLAGEPNKGGEFLYINETGTVETVELAPPSFILLTRDTLHKVNSYYGSTPRISFNFNFDIRV